MSDLLSVDDLLSYMTYLIHCSAPTVLIMSSQLRNPVFVLPELPDFRELRSVY